MLIFLNSFFSIFFLQSFSFSCSPRLICGLSPLFACFFFFLVFSLISLLFLFLFVFSSEVPSHFYFSFFRLICLFVVSLFSIVCFFVFLSFFFVFVPVP